MFLQIQLNPEDRKYHRFLWRTDDTAAPSTYQFTRVVFGVKASPYLAGRALQECANMFGSKYEKSIPPIVHENFYVDDMLNSFASVSKAKSARTGIKSMLKDGGFHIRKWLSNSVDVMESIPEEDRATNKVLQVGDHSHSTLPSTKTLGVSWNATEDFFTFVYPDVSESKALTKRVVLKKMSTVFDPRGQISPFTVRARMMFQQLCIQGYGWDDKISDADGKQWQRWLAELPTLSQIQADRCFKLQDQPADSATLQVHTFVDASDNAYAAASYIRAEYPDGTVKVTLALSKARPAPIRKLTIPKLELKAAVQGVQLSRELQEALNLPISMHTFWTDSMNVLYWVRSLSRKFQTDIGTKISEIHADTSGSQWRHVPGRLNPADMPSRGLPATDLVNNSVWWSGPEFLKQPAEEWPIRDITVPSQLPDQTKRSLASTTLTTVQSYADSRLDPARFSNWKKLARVTAWCVRFISRASKTRSKGTGLYRAISTSTNSVSVKTRKQSWQVPELSVEELQHAEHIWLSVAQRQVYGDSVNLLQQKKPLPSNDSLLPLNPTLNTDTCPALLEVHGRLDNAQISTTARRPIILPNQHPVTSLIIADEDDRCHHAFGNNYVLANLRQQYWIVRGKQAVKTYRHNCNGCKKKKKKTATQLMGQLPPERVAVTERAFSNIGVDYAGPFLTRQGRGRTQAKRYLCLFTCLETRACHLEMAYDMTSQGFLMCFSRFRKRRGTPRNVVSDNGLNFVSAERELREAVRKLSDTDMAAALEAEGIRWKFNPPGAPHHGGVFESMIKSAKRAIYAVLGNGVCNDEELETVFIEAEALLNARPLTTISDDPDDMLPLTPQHFLIGHNDVKHGIEQDADAQRRCHPNDRWRVVQRLVKDVWRRLVKEVLPALNIRQKWSRQKRNVKIGDVVICVDQNTPRGSWPLGRVVQVYPAADGCVRVVDVRIRQKVYRRSISVLIPLENE